MVCIDFMNVGYGDSILIRERQGAGEFRMLVDCGGPGARGGKGCRITPAEYLRKANIDSLDVLLITHLHLDHTDGLMDVLRQTDVGELWAAYVPELPGRQAQAPKGCSAGAEELVYSVNGYSRALKYASDNGVLVRRIGADIPAFKPGKGELAIELLTGPPDFYIWQANVLDKALCGGLDRDDMERLDLTVNDHSLILLLDSMGKRIILPGDCVASVLERYVEGPCDVLKLPHHGRDNSVTETLMRELRPQYTVVSVADDMPGCPDIPAMELAARYSRRLLYTDAVSLYGEEPSRHEAVMFRIEDGDLELLNRI